VAPWLGSVPVMIHREGTNDPKENGLVVSQAVLGGAIEVYRHHGPAEESFVPFVPSW
jgi:hypothetical protein